MSLPTNGFRPLLVATLAVTAIAGYVTASIFLEEEWTMGSYDSVFVACPECGTRVEVQTKSGECMLRRYKGESVPTDVAVGVDGVTAGCEQCSAALVLRADVPKRVIVRAVEDKDEPEEEEWD